MYILCVCVSHHDHLLQCVILVWTRMDSEFAIHWHNLPVNCFFFCSETDCKVVLVGAWTHNECTRATKRNIIIIVI